MASDALVLTHVCDWNQYSISTRKNGIDYKPITTYKQQGLLYHKLLPKPYPMKKRTWFRILLLKIRWYLRDNRTPEQQEKDQIDQAW
jgi:hypothetical protein